MSFENVSVHNQDLEQQARTLRALLAHGQDVLDGRRPFATTIINGLTAQLKYLHDEVPAEQEQADHIRSMIQRLPRAEIKNRLAQIKEMATSVRKVAAEQAISDLADLIQTYNNRGLIDSTEKHSYLETLRYTKLHIP